MENNQLTLEIKTYHNNNDNNNNNYNNNMFVHTCKVLSIPI